MYPPNMYTVTSISNMMSVVLTGNAIALAASSRGAVDRQLITIGEPVWDECDCGTLIAALNSVYPSEAFPVSAVDRRVANCERGHIVADCSLHLVRCMLTVTEDAQAPSARGMTTQGLAVFEDEYFLRQTTTCILNGMYKLPPGPASITDYIINDALPLGPQGACGGIKLNFKVGFGRNCECVA